jgi:hypothetical protein
MDAPVHESHRRAGGPWRLVLGIVLALVVTALRRAAAVAEVIAVTLPALAGQLRRDADGIEIR